MRKLIIITLIAIATVANAQTHVKFIERPVGVETYIDVDELVEAIATADTIYNLGTNFCLKTERNNKWDLFVLIKDPNDMVYDLTIITKDGLSLTLGEAPYASNNMTILNEKLLNRIDPIIEFIKMPKKDSVVQYRYSDFTNPKSIDTTDRHITVIFENNTIVIPKNNTYATKIIRNHRGWPFMIKDPKKLEKYPWFPKTQKVP